MTNEPQETQALTVRSDSALTVDTALAEWLEYQRFTSELLEDSDYQQIGKDGRFKKKSAWRKYARFYNLTDEVTFEQIERDARGRPIFARIRVKVTAPNGRSAESDQECHAIERCCPESYGAECRKNGWRGHECCANGCLGFMHFSNPGDIPATALTRAKNRAIADLIGAGEVSAEEINDRNAPEAPPSASEPEQATRRQQRSESAAQSESSWSEGAHKFVAAACKAYGLLDADIFHILEVANGDELIEKAKLTEGGWITLAATMHERQAAPA